MNVKHNVTDKINVYGGNPFRMLGDIINMNEDIYESRGHPEVISKRRRLLLLGDGTACQIYLRSQVRMSDDRDRIHKQAIYGI